MRMRWMPFACLGVLLVGFQVFLSLSASQLPDPMASHFGLEGQADGWSPRSDYLVSLRILGAALPLGILAVAGLTRFMPAWSINLPNKGFWLAPERRAYTSGLLMGYMAWFSCLLTALFAAMHALTIRANQAAHAGLPSAAFAVCLGAFVMAVGVWLFSLYRRFRLP